MYRQFYLINAEGKRFDLTDKNSKIFLNDPKGLGYTKALTTIRVGNKNLISSSKYNFPSPSGSLLFHGEVEKAYSDYDKFLKFVSLTPLYLFYLQPNNSQAVYLECEVTQVDKGEYSKNGSLEVSVTFSGLSQWLSEDTHRIILSKQAPGDTGKVYDFSRPYSYTSLDSSFENTSIKNEGTLPTSIIVEIVCGSGGYVEDPKITFVQYNETYGTISLSGKYSYVRIDSDDINESIYLEDENTGTVVHPENAQDLSITNGGSLTFIKLKPGVTSMQFHCKNMDTFGGKLVLAYHDQFTSGTASHTS